MSADLLKETKVPLTQLAREQDVDVSTAWRWTLRGVRGHVLESFNLGGRKFTTRQAFARFVARINGEPIRSETPRQREKRLRAAEKRAESLGV